MPGRQMGRTAITLAAMASITVMLAGGCGSASGTSSDDLAAETRAGIASKLLDDQSAGQGGTDDANSGAESSDAVTRAADVDRKVAACMATAGFEWQTGYFSALAEIVEDFDRTTADEFAGAFGFGISTRIGQGDLSRGPVTSVPKDPNADIRAALTEQEQAAYDSARGRCMEDAGELSDTSADQGSPDVNRVLDQANEEVRSDPRYREAQGRWSGCMAEAGFSYADDVSMISDLEAQAAGFRETFDRARAANPSAGPDDVFDVDTLGELHALQQRELGVAAADRACRGELDEVYAQVHEEVLRSFAQGVDN